MKKLALALAVVLLLVPASEARADVTIRVTMSIGGPMPFGDMPFVIQVKGTSLRADARWSDTEDVSMLIDLSSGQRVWLDHHAKEAGPPPVGDVLCFYHLARGFQIYPSSEVTASLKPNRRAKEVLNNNCSGFDARVAQRVKLKGVNVVSPRGRSNELEMSASGTAWVAREGAGVQEYRAFLEAASGAGILVWPLGWGDASEGGTDLKGIIAMQKTLAEAGLPLLLEWKSAFDGSTVTMKVTEISTDAIPDEKIAVPAGYTRK